MEEQNENILEEVTQNKTVEETVEQPVEETKPEATKVSIPSFGSLEPTVTKVDLSTPINQE